MTAELHSLAQVYLAEVVTALSASMATNEDGDEAAGNRMEANRNSGCGISVANCPLTCCRTVCCY